MSHEIDRILQAAAGRVWLIEPRKAREIAAVLALRAHGQPRAWEGDAAPEQQMAADTIEGRRGAVHVLRIMGTIMPRATIMSEMSGGTSMDRFQKAFRQAADDPNASAIVIEIDSPGGMVDQVPETARMIHAARRANRPIIAVANSLAASAAYYLAAAADEIVVTPSGNVGSIGVYVLLDDLTKYMEKEGIKRTIVREGPRKIEANPFEPLSDEGRAALQAEISYTYDMFTSDIAKFRGVPKAVVRADPESAEEHMGGGRVYNAREALRLRMADRIATFDDTLMQAAQGRRSRRASLYRKRLSVT